MAVRKGDLLQGTLDLLVLKVLGAGPNHGYGIATRLHQLSDDVLRVEEGSDAEGTPHGAGRARRLAAAVRHRRARAARARARSVIWPCDRRASFAAYSHCSDGTRGIATWSARWRSISIRSHATARVTG